MKTNYLLPNAFKKIGWVLFSVGIISGLYSIFVNESPALFDAKVFAFLVDKFTLTIGSKNTEFFTIYENNIFDELICILLIVGGIFVAFSKQRIEDEFISKIRVESLIWATYCNYIILLLAILFVYGVSFFSIMIFNMFTVLMFFIIRFNWAYFKLKKTANNEE
ncbi:hypothetical protein [Mesonia maritima]|uniref:Uncharacterized protein YacL n=2 Tax=Mesonia maritima TaxID=1793873 RepID=A0ABU1K6A1_9FLAO|nr:hypothetical protein [Mesonia maritima]MDR6301136.1 uncharacterized protein YacL [Mesonia maritima]